MKETTGNIPDKMSLDNGYMSADNLEAIEYTDIDVYSVDSHIKQTSIPRLF